MADARRLYWLVTGITAACLFFGMAVSLGLYWWVTTYPHTVVEAVLLLCCGVFGRIIYRECKRGFGYIGEVRAGESREQRVTRLRRIA